MDSGIYVISSPSGRVYIGSSKSLSKRKTQHFYKLRNGVHPCDALQKAFIKYDARLNFVVIENCAEELLIEREQHWIDIASKVWVKRIYNSSGIAGRPEHTAEVRKKISDKAKGRIVSEETKRKLSEAGKGRKHSEETLEKMRNYKFTPDQLEKIRINNQNQIKSEKDIERLRELARKRVGISLSASQKAKMSEAQRNRAPPSEETRRKLSIAKTGASRRPVSPEGLANLREGAKKRSEAAALRRAEKVCTYDFL